MSSKEEMCGKSCKISEKEAKFSKSTQLMVYSNNYVVLAGTLPNREAYENPCGVLYEIGCPVSSSNCY